MMRASTQATSWCEELEPEQSEMVTHGTGQSPVWKVDGTRSRRLVTYREIDQMNIYFKGNVVCDFQCWRREL